MTIYLLDTNIISYLEDAESCFYNKLINTISSLNDSDIVSISVLSLYEYEYSMAHADSILRDRLLKTQSTIKDIFTVLPLSAEGAEIFGILKNDYLKKTGINKKAINRHNVDFMLASTAIVENAVMVSNDNIFKQLKEITPKLQYENWTD